MLYQIIIVFHILLGVGIIGLVLMQQGKGADAGAAFGSGASGSVFGAQGSASFLSRTTAIFATLFFLTSLGLAILSGYQGKKTDIMQAPVVEEIKSDVPLSKSTAEDSVPVAELPEAPAIKEVQPAEQPAKAK
jgi:preprotein translocase subunit SecG